MRLLFVLHHSATPSTTKQVVENARSIYAKQSISFVANVVRNGVHHQVCSLCAKLKIHSFSFSHCTPGIEFCNICLASEFSRFTPSSVCMQFFFFSSPVCSFSFPVRRTPNGKQQGVCGQKTKCAIRSKLSTRKCHNRHRHSVHAQNTLFSLFAILFVTRS